jgi:hypothetical protein
VRRAAKVDANHGQVVSALEAAGAKVQSLAELGRGVPDLLVRYGERLFLLEVKDGNKSPSKRDLTPDQVEWIKQWGGGVHVVLSPDDALKAIGALA